MIPRRTFIPENCYDMGFVGKQNCMTISSVSCEKICFCIFEQKGTDRSVHPPSLINTFLFAA